MEISVMVRGYSQDTLRAFLDFAAELGLPISDVRSTPMGLFIPVALAQRAGLIEPEKPAEKPKRTRTKVKTGFNTDPVQEEVLWDE